MKGLLDEVTGSGVEHSRGTAELSQLSSDGVSLECQGEKCSMRCQGLKRLDTQGFVKKKKKK